MLIPDQALQFAGSLIAILVLAWLVKRLGLGKDPVLTDDNHAIAVATEVLDGFAAQEVARDADGTGALLRDAQGQIILLKPHGGHFAGRVLNSSASAKLSDNEIQITSGEKRFGDVHLIIDDAASWVEAINRLNSTSNA
ncbi:hypothetical protein ACRAQ6_05045 [Erythrobacter sp. HA6-11]